MVVHVVVCGLQAICCFISGIKRVWVHGQLKTGNSPALIACGGVCDFLLHLLVCFFCTSLLGVFISNLSLVYTIRSGFLQA